MNLRKERLTALFILSAFTVVFLFSAFHLSFKESGSLEYVCSVEIEYYGSDEQKIEELITIPLENELRKLSNVLEIFSCIQKNKSTTSIYFESSVDKTKTYLSLRSAVDSVYESFPSDVQRPRFYNTSSDSRPCFEVAFPCTDEYKLEELRSLVQNMIKPKILAFEDVADVVLNGGAVKEIHVSFNNEKLLKTSKTPLQIATVIQDSNFVLPAAGCKENKNLINFSTRVKDLNTLSDVPLFFEKSLTYLNDLACIKEDFRDEEEIVLLSGRPCVSLGVLLSSGGSKIKLCNECKTEIKNICEDLQIEYEVLRDEGNRDLSLIKKMAFALLLSFVCVVIVVPLFFNKIEVVFLDLVFLFINVVWTLGIMSVFKISLNSETLSGLSISLGLAADSLFVVNENAFSSNSELDFFCKVKKSVPSIFSSTITTILVLIPLCFLEYLVKGVKVIAFLCGIMVTASFVLSVFFYPFFIYEASFGNSVFNECVIKNMHAVFENKLLFLSEKFVKKEKICLILVVFLTITVGIVLLFSGKNFTQENNYDVINASVEYDGNLSVDAVCNILRDFETELLNLNEISFILSNYSQGRADFEISLLSAKYYSRVSKTMKQMENLLGGGFLYIPVEEKNTKSITINFLGDELLKCKKNAFDFSEATFNQKKNWSVIYNFKRPPEEIVFIPDRLKLLKNGLTSLEAESFLRCYLFGPVVDKWITDKNEMDIRLRSDSYKINSESLKSIKLPSENSFIPLEALGSIEKKDSIGTVYRLNSRHVASVLVESNCNSYSKFAGDVKCFLDEFSFDSGYSVCFSRKIQNLSKTYITLFKSLIFSILFLYLLLVFLFENFKTSFCVFITIPLSFFLPVFIRFISGGVFETGDVIGMVLLSGITVNNAIYIASDNEKNAILKLKKHLSSVFSSSLTSIVGALPVLFMAEGGLSYRLSFFMLWGLISSLVVCTVFLPCLLKKMLK